MSELKLYHIEDATEENTPTMEEVMNLTSSKIRNLNEPVQMQQNYMQSANFVSGSAGWKIDAQGNLEANDGNFRGDITGASGTFSGTITATTGSIGGWTIGTDYIRDTAGVVGLSSAVTGGDDIRFWAGDATPGSAEFRVTESGALTATSATISGAITATSGAIGGWTINSTSIYTGTEDHSAYTTNAGDLTIYSDGADASIHAFNWYIDTSGNFHTRSGDISGVSITAIPNNTSTDISLLSNTHDLTFSASDLDTVAWTSGTITLSNARTFSISSGNTGNISARTYIYLDPAISSTVLQTTTTVATAHGANKIPLAVAINSTDKAEFVVFNGTGNRNILVDNIAANSTSTNEFVSNTAQIKNLVVTNAKINDLAVSKLTAGTITSQSVVLAANGTGDAEIRSGIASGDFTNAGAASGFIIGVDDSDSDKAKFYFGSSSAYISFDGATLQVSAVSQVVKSYTAGEPMPVAASVFVENSGTDIDKFTTTGGATDFIFGNTSAGTDREKMAQSFTTTSAVRLSKIILSIRKNGSPGDSVKIGIQANSGSDPSGVFLTSATVLGSTLSATLADTTFTMDSEIDLATATVYWVVAERTGALNNTDEYSIGVDNGGNPYAGGVESDFVQSTQTWTPNAGVDFAVKLVTTTVTGRIYKTTALNTAESNAFIGFNTAAVTTTGSTAIIAISGEATGFSGLTSGTFYYLSDSYGALSATVGTVTRKAAIATSATTALISNVW